MWPWAKGPSVTQRPPPPPVFLCGAWLLRLGAGTVLGTRLVPVALQQLNLKLPPAVVAHWKARAKAEGLSIRDWLLAEVAAPPAGPAGGSGLADRVSQLEAQLAELREVVAALAGPPRRSPKTAEAPSPKRVSPALQSGT